MPIVKYWRQAVRCENFDPNRIQKFIDILLDVGCMVEDKCTPKVVNILSERFALKGTPQEIKFNHVAKKFDMYSLLVLCHVYLQKTIICSD